MKVEWSIRTALGREDFGRVEADSTIGALRDILTRPDLLAKYEARRFAAMTIIVNPVDAGEAAKK